MTPEEWQRVRPILESALELDPSSRPRFLDGACADAAVRREVESLIAYHEQAGTAFLNPAASPGSGAEEEACFRLPPGKRIGVYEILGEIAQGGMGAVYRAIRADGQYKQQVALKIVRADLGTELTATRFRNERQILASLDHPNIARLLDGGTSEEGVPYFVMELIEGQPIDQYCDERKLTTDARLKLVIDVCGAVQYAHRRLIVHRDIKPSNILVTKDGVPKLLDFGIAKILATAEFEGVNRTTLSMRVLTPAYASPEQIKGEPITTASDVYSLGVVLYELLTGHHPYPVATRTPEALALAVCEHEPEKPSTVVRRPERSGTDRRQEITPDAVSAVREGSPEKLSRRLTGDLDKIVLMALRKEPERRYASVEQFAEDIRRHLGDLPVAARGDAGSYRARKFIRRHRAGVSAAALVMLILVAGIIVTVREARIARVERARAERRFNDVRKLANSLIFEIHDSVKDIPGATATRKLIVDRGLEYLDSLAGESAADPTLQSELAAAYRRIGDAQGERFAANLGDSAGALNSYQKSLKIQERIYASDPNRLENIVALAESYRSVSDKLLSSGQTGEAYKDIQRAVQLGENALPSHPNDVSLIQELFDDYESEGDLLGANWNLSNLGDRAGALAAAQKDMELAERLVKLRPTDPSIQRLSAVSLARMGDQVRLAGQRHLSLSYYLQAEAIIENLAAQTPTARMLDLLHVTYERLAIVHMLNGDLPQAIELARRGLEISSRLSAADPKDTWARLSVAEDNSNLADDISLTPDKREAFPPVEKALSIINDLVAHDPQNTELQGVQASILSTFGDVYRRTGNPSKALSYYRKMVAIAEKTQADDPKNEDARLRLAANYNSLASALVMVGNAKAAIELYEKALSLVDAVVKSKSPSEQAIYSGADSYTGLGDAEIRLAGKETQPARQTAHSKKACEWYEASLKTWSAIPEPGVESPEGYECVQPASVAARLRRCQAVATETSHK